MGLFKSILGSVAESVISQVKDAIKASTESTPAAKPAQRQEVYTPSEPEVWRNDAEWKAYFAEIIATEFPRFSVRQNVPVTELAGFVADEFQLYSTRPRQVYRAEWGAPYTFVLYEGAFPKGIVMLGNGHSHDSNVKYLIARSYAKKLGLPYINFYTQMPNERSYVISRIARFVGR